MTHSQQFDFFVIGGDAVHELVSRDRVAIMSRVQDAYAAHGAGKTVNPDSYFLRFPDKANARIIALPAYLGGGLDVAGIKWIASFPDNISRGIPRASAVLILNDYETGYPIACLESSIISAARTAASAVLGAEWLNRGKLQARNVGFIGNGLISRYIADFFFDKGWSFENVYLFDLERSYSEAMAKHIHEQRCANVLYADSTEALIRQCDVVVFATTAPTPYIQDPALFSHNPVVLNVSLRDLSPEIILSADNIVDDVDHCLKANTSPHLAEQRVGNRAFVNGTLDELIRGKIRLSGDRPRIFSPFGMGILDLAVGIHVYREAIAAGRAIRIDNFFHERKRW